MHTVFQCRGAVSARGGKIQWVRKCSNPAGAVRLRGTVMAGQDQTRRLSREIHLRHKPYLLADIPHNLFWLFGFAITFLLTAQNLLSIILLVINQSLGKRLLNSCLLVFATSMQQFYNVLGSISQVLAATVLLIVFSFLFVTWTLSKSLPAVILDGRSSPASTRYYGDSEVQNGIKVCHKVKQNHKMDSSGQANGKHKLLARDMSHEFNKDNAGNLVFVDEERRDAKQVRTKKGYVYLECSMQSAMPPINDEELINSDVDHFREWRKGLEGPKILCNACGVRWLKAERKKPQSQESDRHMPYIARAKSGKLKNVTIC